MITGLADNHRAFQKVRAVTLAVVASCEALTWDADGVILRARTLDLQAVYSNTS